LTITKPKKGKRIQDNNLWDVALNVLDEKEAKLDLSEFKSFKDINLEAKLSNITGSGKGNVVREDKSIDTKKAQEYLDEIKKVFI